MIEQYNPLKGEMFQILDEKGQIESVLEPALSDEELKKIYAFIVVSRQTDLKAFFYKNLVFLIASISSLFSPISTC